MKIHVQRGKMTGYRTEALVAAHFEDGILAQEPAGLLDRACGGQIENLIASGDFRGKLYQTAVIRTGGAIPARRIMIVGLGKQADFSPEKLRGAYAAAARQARDLNLKEFALAVDGGFGGKAGVAQEMLPGARQIGRVGGTQPCGPFVAAIAVQQRMMAEIPHRTQRPAGDQARRDDWKQAERTPQAAPASTDAATPVEDDEIDFRIVNTRRIIAGRQIERTQQH